MKDALKKRLESIGWDALYEEHINNLAVPNSKGERRALSPFPDTVDRNPSFTVNVTTGLWHCFKTKRGGDYVNFLAIINADEFDEETGYAIQDYQGTERELLLKYNISRPIDPNWVTSCVDALYEDLTLQHGINRVKPWNREVLKQMKIGYSLMDDRIVMPVYDRKGKLVNCRMYKPGAMPKFVWKEENTGENFLWPKIAYTEKSMILVEGEPDVISLRSFGFSAVCGTVGAGQPVPDGEWWRDKYIYILMDADAAGEKATEIAANRMVDLAAEVRIVTLPEWDGRGEKADVSDYIMYLLRSGLTVEQVQACISQLLTNAVAVEKKDSFLDSEALPLSFKDALNSSNLNTRVKFQARVTAKSSSKFVLPVSYTLSCPASGHSFCKNCPMQRNYRGNGTFVKDPRTKDSLRLIQTSDEGQTAVYKELHGVPKSCPDLRHVTNRAIDVEAVILSSCISGGIVADESVAERQRREAFIIVPPNFSIEENREYIMEGFMYPHPKTQQAILLIDSFQAVISEYENFEPTPEVISMLRQFAVKPGQTTMEKLCDVAVDLEQSTTLIYGRIDLHLAYRTVYHSALSFTFAGHTITRGWVECLVMGDTRCGKSETFRKMSEYYGVGILIDCKMQTAPGILGTVVQSNTGEYYAVAGLLPQQDGKVVCFDEFTTKWGQQSIIEVLSSTRSEGVVRISKAASAEYKARVRSIWLANPGTGKLISQHASPGCQLIARVINQPEDIARFDMALTVAQEDVSPVVINQLTRPSTPRYDSHASRTLLSWIYSRKPEQIVFAPDAEQRVIDYAIEMCSEYDQSIPLVEIADQRRRIAKIAVSVAGQVFSTDAEGNQIIVTRDHVDTARELFSVWYDKPAMGYRNVSKAKHDDETLLDTNAIIMMFTQSLHPNGFRLAEELLRLDEISERVLGTIVPIDQFYTRTFLQQLYLNRAVRVVNRGRSRESYEKTVAFTNWLKSYVRQTAAFNEFSTNLHRCSDVPPNEVV